VTVGVAWWMPITTGRPPSTSTSTTERFGPWLLNRMSDVDPVTSQEAVVHIGLSNGAEAEQPRPLRHVLFEQTMGRSLTPSNPARDVVLALGQRADVVELDDPGRCGQKGLELVSPPEDRRALANPLDPVEVALGARDRASSRIRCGCAPECPLRRRCSGLHWTRSDSSGHLLCPRCVSLSAHHFDLSRSPAWANPSTTSICTVVLLGRPSTPRSLCP